MKMRLKLSALVIGACLLFTPLPSAKGNFNNGARYLQMKEGERNIYVMGLHDSWSFFSDAVYNIVDQRSQTRFDRINRCLSPMSVGELRALVDDYIRSDQARLRYNMGSNFDTALGEKCYPRR